MSQSHFQVFTILWVCYCSITKSFCVQESRFFAGHMTCHDDDVIISHGCAERAPSTTQNRHQCMSKCVQQEWCVGVTVDTSDRSHCVLYSKCSWNVECPSENFDPDQKDSSGRSVHYYSKNCAHGGQWQTDDHKCRCVHGWVGERCQQIPSDRSQMVTAGYPYGSYRTYFNLREATISQHGSPSSSLKSIIPLHINVNPTISYTNFNLVIHNGSMDFNRSFMDYKDGFYQDDHNYWIGLDNWRSLGDAGIWRKTFFVLVFKSGKNVYRWYENFTFKEVSSGAGVNEPFGLSYGYTSFNEIGGFNLGHFGDCFEVLPRDVAFSAWDRDADGLSSLNCAALRGSGWWFHNGCHSECNLLGQVPAVWDPTVEGHQFYLKGVNHYVFLQDPFDHFSIYLE